MTKRPPGYIKEKQDKTSLKTLGGSVRSMTHHSVERVSFLDFSKQELSALPSALPKYHSTPIQFSQSPKV